ncbi:unnamed protein product [Urochloa humidicola]
MKTTSSSREKGSICSTHLATCCMSYLWYEDEDSLPPSPPLDAGAGSAARALAVCPSSCSSSTITSSALSDDVPASPGATIRIDTSSCPAPAPAWCAPPPGSGRRMPEYSSSAVSGAWMKLEAEKCTPYLLDGAGGCGGGGGDGGRDGWACGGGGGGASIRRDGAREGWSFQRRIPPRRRRRRPGGAASGAEGDGGGDDVGAAPPRPHAARRRRWRVPVLVAVVVAARSWWEEFLEAYRIFLWSARLV